MPLTAHAALLVHVHDPTAATKGHEEDSIADALKLADYKAAFVSTKEDGAKVGAP